MHNDFQNTIALLPCSCHLLARSESSVSVQVSLIESSLLEVLPKLFIGATTVIN